MLLDNYIAAAARMQLAALSNDVALQRRGQPARNPLEPLLVQARLG